MKITVTAKHIEQGQRKEMSYCPIALAIKDAVPEAKEVYVGMRWYIWLQKAFPAACINGKDFRVSKRVAQQAIAFDEGKHIEPFSFRLMPLRKV